MNGGNRQIKKQQHNSKITRDVETDCLCSALQTDNEPRSPDHHSLKPERKSEKEERESQTRARGEFE